MNEKKHIIVIGAGFAGISMALALASANIKVTVIDRKPLEESLYNKKSTRTLTLSHGTALFMQKIGLWEHMHEQATPVNDICVKDAHGNGFIHFNHQEAGDSPMGYVLPNSSIMQIFIRQLKSNRSINVIDNAVIRDIIDDQNQITIEFENNNKINADIAIAADGKYSDMRRRINVAHKEIKHHQIAMTMYAYHDGHHCNTATEYFRETGPFALLPMPGGFSSSVIWTETIPRANTISNLPQDKIINLMQNNIPNFMGKVHAISSIDKYELVTIRSQKYHANRMFFIGDALHTMHPIAGQGFNLSIHDIKVLASILTDYVTTGTPFNIRLIGEEFRNGCILKDVSMLYGTHILNSLFIANNKIIRLARSTGLSLVQKINPIKKFFIKKAMGI